MGIDQAFSELISEYYATDCSIVFNQIWEKSYLSLMDFSKKKPKLHTKEIREDQLLKTTLRVMDRVRKKAFINRNFEGFLYWTFHNNIIDVRRYETQRAHVSLKSVHWKMKQEEEQVLEYPYLQHLEEALDHIPGYQREVFEARVFHKLPFEDLAIRQGVDENAANARFRYAKNNIKKYLKKTYGIEV